MHSLHRGHLGLLGALQAAIFKLDVLLSILCGIKITSELITPIFRSTLPPSIVPHPSINIEMFSVALRKLVADFHQLTFKDWQREFLKPTRKRAVAYKLDSTLKATSNRKFDIDTAHLIIKTYVKKENHFHPRFVKMSIAAERYQEELAHNISKMALLTINHTVICNV